MSSNISLLLWMPEDCPRAEGNRASPLTHKPLQVRSGRPINTQFWRSSAVSTCLPVAVVGVADATRNMQKFIDSHRWLMHTGCEGCACVLRGILECVCNNTQHASASPEGHPSPQDSWQRESCTVFCQRYRYLCMIYDKTTKYIQGGGIASC